MTDGKQMRPLLISICPHLINNQLENEEAGYENEYCFIEFFLYKVKISAFANLNDFRYKLYLENEDDEVGAVMETGSVEENDEEENNAHGKENQRPNNQIGRFGIF